MKKYSAIIYISLLCVACGGGLSDDQRKALKEEMEQREIKKVAEEDVVDAAFKRGKELLVSHQAGADSVVINAGAEVRLLLQNDSTASKVEWELLEAYKYSMTQGAQPTENVQRDGEMMVYTMPAIENDMFVGIYIVRVPRKEIILNL